MQVVLRLLRRKANSSQFQMILTQTLMVVKPVTRGNKGSIKMMKILKLRIAKMTNTYLQEMKLTIKKICQPLPASVCLQKKPRLSFSEALSSAKCTLRGLPIRVRSASCQRKVSLRSWHLDHQTNGSQSESNLKNMYCASMSPSMVVRCSAVLISTSLE